MELESTRLVAFYRAAVGSAFNTVLNQCLKRRQYDLKQRALRGIKAEYDVSFERLGFLQIKHPLDPLLVQYTQVYCHILDTKQKNDEILQNLFNNDERKQQITLS